MQYKDDKSAKFCNKFNFMLKIKEIRELRGLTQDDMVVKTGISKRSYVDYENGKADIQLSKLQNIATILDVRLSDLLNESKSKENVPKKKGDNFGDDFGDIQNVKKMSPNKLLHFSEPKEMYQSRIPAVVTIDSNNEDNIALVPIPLSAGYLEGYNDKDFIAKLPSYRMPGLNNGVFRMFEVEGNSMYPTLPNKSFVVGQFVENWIRDIRDNQIYAVISNEVEGGLVKRCVNKIKKYNNLICKSDNRRSYPSQNISPESIKEIWEIKLHLNFHLPDPADIYDRMSDLEGEVSSLKEIVRKANLLPNQK